MKRICIAALLSLIFLTGCWDSIELNDRAIVLGGGMDLDEEGQYVSSLQIAIPSKFGQINQRGGEAPEQSVLVKAATGKTAFDARQNIQNKVERKIFRLQQQSFFAGEELAKQGLKESIDMRLRYNDFPVRANYSVVKGGRSVDLLTNTSDLEVATSLSTNNIQKQFAQGVTTTFLDFQKRMYGPSNPVLTAWEIQSSPGLSGPEQSVDFYGLAAFNKELQLVGYLNEDESKDLLWIQNKLEYIALVIPYGGQDQTAGLRVQDLKRKISPKVKDGKMHLHVQLDGKGSVQENNTNLDLSASKDVERLEKEAEKYYQKRVEDMIDKVQSEYQTDILDFGLTLFRKHPQEWKQVKQNWEEIFTETEVTVDVNIKIRDVGLVT
ncbi:Ger(x)C family spore germination protein [Halobacillus sp. A5]|uniref:Ger(x)C family spore germination protein n=1 Tax=Halobacillus sp. A5 TaxID=2880263 RepID=UPI0020A64967|nr:Ger(x)C family spore germination protein [Halobacillus sp. A5]MCP3028796.1 Ger(x)C family spore germination protein [Halobacillus sp. A5]